MGKDIFGVMRKGSSTIRNIVCVMEHIGYIDKCFFRLMEKIPYMAICVRRGIDTLHVKEALLSRTLSSIDFHEMFRHSFSAETDKGVLLEIHEFYVQKQGRI